MTIAAPDIDADLLQRLGLGDEAAIERGLDLLTKGVTPPTLMALVKGLVAQGLALLAAELLRGPGAPLLADAGIARLADQLAAMRCDRLSPQQQAVNAERNIAALAARREQIPADVATWLASDRIDVLTDRSGRTHAVMRGTDGAVRLATALRFALDGVERDAIRRADPPMIALLGLPARHRLDDLLVAGTSNHLRPAFVAFESDPAMIAAWLRSGDFSEELRSGFLRCRLGDDGIERYLAGMQTSLAVAPLTSAVFIRPESPLRRAVCAAVPESSAVWSRSNTEFERIARERYDARGARYWLPRYRAARAGAGALRIFGIVSRHTQVIRHMMRDLLGAFEDRGHVVQLVTEHEESDPIVDSLTPLVEGDADLVVSINCLRQRPRPLIPFQVPSAAWMQDAIGPAQTLEAGAEQGPLDLLITQSPGFWESCFGYPAQQSIATPNLTSWRMFGRIGDEPRRRGAPDVAYVGHGWESVEMLAKVTAKNDKAAAVLADIASICRALLERGVVPNGFERLRIIATVLGKRGLYPGEWGRPLYWASQIAFDRLFRHQALHWAAAWAESRGKTFAIYGEGWHQHPTLARFARGPVENGRPLGELCRDAGAMLHANGNASLHQRLLDGLASNGCVLTRRNCADELPRHHRALAERARALNLRTLRGALEAARHDAPLRAALANIERTLGCAIAPIGDAGRNSDIEVIERTAFWPADTLEDDGLFRHLAQERGVMTQHGAADVDGFDAASYGSEAELHALLDQVTNDEAFRAALVAPMRASVRQHFTMEWLVDAIIERMTSMLERAAR